MDYSLPLFLYIFMLLGLTMLIKNEDEQINITKKQRWILFLVFSASLSLVFLSMYLIWSKIGGDKVQGVQGRYFISIFPLLILAFYKSKFSINFDFIKKNKNAAVIIFMAVSFFFVFLSMFGIYYEKTGAGNKYSYDKFLTRAQVQAAQTTEAKKSFQQTFHSTKDGLTGIKVYIKKEFIEGQNITFYLKDKECDTIIRKKTVTEDGVELSSLDVNFGVVSDSQDKDYCLSAEINSEKSLSVSLSPVDYPEGNFVLDGISQEKDLAFYITYKN